MTYLRSAVERETLRALPLEAWSYGLDPDRMIARLKEERALARAGDAALTIVLLLERAPDLALSKSLASISLQSHPGVATLLAPLKPIDKDYLDQFLAEQDVPVRNLSLFDSSAPLKRQITSRFVTFLRHGDRLHPSVAAYAARADADILFWRELQPRRNGRPIWIQSSSAPLPENVAHMAYVRNAFAVRAKLLESYDGDPIREAAQNDLHLFMIECAGQNGLRWSTHQECFLIRADARASESLDHATTRAFSFSEERYRAALSDEDWTFIVAQAAASPYRRTPKRRARSISVVIPYRDKPDLTLRALRSLREQNTAANVEIMLIDNQSADESNAAIESALQNEAFPFEWRRIVYPQPFNHSAQCNLGVAHSKGEVVVLMNNDCVLAAQDALDEAAAWALVEGVATVGAAMRDPATGAITAGLALRSTPAPAYDSFVDEASHPALTPFVRNVFGNTFAFAAIARASFEKLGPLDEAHFPNGFNDVEFSCRAHARGMRHVVLGHILVDHARGSTRGRVDEAPQKLRLRAHYPGLIHDPEARLEIIERDEQDQPNPRATKSAAQKAPPKPAAARPASPPIHDERSALQRVASRLAETPLARAVLSNPTAHKIIRGAWRLLTGRRP